MPSRPIQPSTTRTSAGNRWVSERKDSPLFHHQTTAMTRGRVMHNKPRNVGHQISRRPIRRNLRNEKDIAGCKSLGPGPISADLRTQSLALRLPNLSSLVLHVRHRVPCVHNTLRPFAEFVIVHARMSGCYDYYIKSGDRLAVPTYRFRSCPLWMLTRGPNHRHIRIVIGYFGPALLEQLHDAVAGGLPLVVHIWLVSEAENQYARPVQGFPRRIQGVSHSLHDVDRHCSVYLARQFDEPSGAFEFSRLPCQIEGIDRDAVSTHSRPGIEGHKTKRFRLGCFNNLPNVNPHRAVDELQLIDKGDVHAAKDVFQQLGSFRHPTRGNRYDGSNRPTV